MLEGVVRFFLKRHLLTNLFFVLVFVGGIFSWKALPKEELPDVTFDFVRISAGYPGASAEEVEYYVTRPIEKAVSSLDGVRDIRSSTGAGRCSISVELETRDSDREEIVADIRNAVLDVRLPDDVSDDPSVSVWKTSRMAVIDIGFTRADQNILSAEGRREMQAAVYAMEQQLLGMPEVSSVSRSGYLDDEIHIGIRPDKLIEYDIPLSTVISEIRAANVRRPAGIIENSMEPKVTVFGELTTPEELRDLAIQGGFEGQVVRLGDVADVEWGYQKASSVTKINGREGILLRVVKSSSVGILDAVDAVIGKVQSFSENNLRDTQVEMVLLDDESIGVRNRISIIATNGSIGFILILIVLFIFLDARSGVWVALGIPFSLCLTLIVALMMGYTVNNITLAAVIIVMGMVVDDAIVVAENIMRSRSEGMGPVEAGAHGTVYVFLAIIASILTTCVAFVPLLFFGGRFSAMVRFIPIIVSVMLMASLVEALFVLPGHMSLGRANIRVGFLGRLPFLRSRSRSRHVDTRDVQERPQKSHWFERVESFYVRQIERLLAGSGIVFLVFTAILAGALCLGATTMDFVIFPGEETGSIRLTGEAPKGSTRYETATICQPIEDILAESLGEEVISFRTDIARTRMGSSARENVFRMGIEIVSKEDRDKSADELIGEWTNRFAAITNISEIQISKTRHGHGSDSPIVIHVRENNNDIRRSVADELAARMEEDSELLNVEIDRPVFNPEHRISLDRDKLRRLAVNPSGIASTLRAALAGTVLYEFTGDNESIDVRLAAVDEAKTNIEQVLEMPVDNQRKYLIPLKSVVSVSNSVTPDSIVRENEKRVTVIYADIDDDAERTPLQIADDFERDIFPSILAKYPSTTMEFRGEVQDTRESGQEFKMAVIMVIVLIYVILALLFNSLTKPLVIMLSIPFSLVGIIIAFKIHGISQYGFFAVVGALGLAGVVINDAIIMLVKLDKEYKSASSARERHSRVARIAGTRLRAVTLTTITTVVGMLPTAYGWAGYDSMLSQMMLAIAWGLLFGTMITLVLVPCVYSVVRKVEDIR